MKISLTISLFFHIIIFTFLNIYRNEEISDELISNVSVISQKKYDALISNKPIITNNFIHQKPVLINSEELLVTGLLNQKEEKNVLNYSKVFSYSFKYLSSITQTITGFCSSTLI